MPAGRKVDIKRNFVYSTPAPALIKMSDEAEMIVVGSSGRGCWPGACSVRSVRPWRGTRIVRSQWSMTKICRTRHARVLVGIDGSPTSERATALAFDEASRRGVDLIALHAWSDVTTEIPYLDWATVEEEAQRSLAESLAGWRQRYPDVTVHRVVVRDRPARHLIEQAESAQLVVVGSHGRGGLTGMLLGSVGNTLLHSVRIPVIVARPA